MILINRIISNENIELAIDKLKRNKGSKTPGIDGIRLKDILADKTEIIMRVQEALRGNNYKPSPVRRIEIPKENGKTRPLGIPTIFDRIIQQSIRQVIEPLIKIRIKEKKIISIIKTMLKTEIVLPNGEIIKPEKGTPQGGILSPLLANVVLNELDWWIDSQWFGKRLDREYKKQKYKKCALKRSRLTEVRIIRYADDFKLLCRTREGADKIFKLVKIFLKERLKLEISKEKSKVINLKKKSSNFLGFRIKAIKRRNTWTARTFIGDKAKKNILLKIRAQIKILAKIPTTTEAMKFNSIIRGIQNYYKIATMVNIDLNKIGYIISKILYIQFGKGSNKKDIMYRMRFPNYNYKVWNIDNITLFTLEALIFKIPKHYSDKNYKSRVDELKESIEEKLYVKVIQNGKYSEQK
ncbi:reverse transcriptase domain-containing protein [Cetobacterium somerae]|uniref:reverse transcriptase domain-containing protein n=1 Tax=Cetobacterium somerae TaxID=188913 RepID=UPI0038913B9F